MVGVLTHVTQLLKSTLCVFHHLLGRHLVGFDQGFIGECVKASGIEVAGQVPHRLTEGLALSAPADGLDQGNRRAEDFPSPI